MYDSTLGTSCGTIRASSAQHRDMLEVSVTEGDSGPVVVLEGEADLTSLPQLNKALAEKTQAGAATLTVDLSRLRFADSAAVAALANADQRLRDQGRRLELRCPQPSVARILRLTGIDRVLTIRGSDC